MGVPGKATVKAGPYTYPPDFDHWEVFVGLASGFTPTGWNGSAWVSEPNAPSDWNGTTATLRVISRSEPIDVLDLTPGTRYYFRLVAVDTSGNRSAPSSEVSAVAGTVQGGDIGSGVVDTPHIAVGAVSSYKAYQIADAFLTETNSTSYVDIPNFAVTFTLAEAALVIVLMALHIKAAYVSGFLAAGGVSYCRLVVDGTPFQERFHQVNARYNNSDLVVAHIGTAAIIDVVQLGAGTHTVKGQFKSWDSGWKTVAGDRQLGVVVLKKEAVL